MSLEEFSTSDPRIHIALGDITQAQVDAIVNAANSSLMGGGGVDGAIHRAGGSSILEECRRIRRSLPDGLPTGEAVVTGAGNLPARFVIHTVGPVWSGGAAGEERLLANAYRNSLQRAVESGARSIAFPGISTGIYGFPKQPAARIAAEEVRAFLADNDTLERVVFVCFDPGSFETYRRLLGQGGPVENRSGE
ncbi:MAG TPA: O-acetyl-ADP-ribose deacetylase [Armatimonadota bacterium]|nr:O-acetyl-ADP-ribose deacetylase [Armatimonadota bacterium]